MVSAVREAYWGGGMSNSMVTAVGREIAEGSDAWDEVRVLKDHAGHDRVLTATKRG